ncbi:MAG TPA: helix-turn-helix domain-containing protein [Beijerinckiaceae bacterium]|jgi:transcriptional regulator with XRE-family HTH domain|nr:helix-turn-helix domain-containing protein [Beijerinckiaceae bacterium]
MNASHFSAHLRRLRKDRGLVQKDVAEALTVSVQAVSQWEKGETTPEYPKVMKLAEFLGVSLDELSWDDAETRHDPTPPSKTVVRVAGLVGAGAEIMPDYEQIPDGLYDIDVLVPVPEGAVALQVEGDSMFPRYDAGDVVICWGEPSSMTEIVGWEAAVRTSDGKRYLKRILQGQKKGTFDLESYNAPPIRGVKLEWVSRVHLVVRAGHWQRLSPREKIRLIKKATGASLKRR